MTIIIIIIVVIIVIVIIVRICAVAFNRAGCSGAVRRKEAGVIRVIVIGVTGIFVAVFLDMRFARFLFLWVLAWLSACNLKRCISQLEMQFMAIAVG